MKNFKTLNFAEKVLFFAPFAMWFSYYPNFHFGKSAGANLEFSIALIYIVVLALAGIKTIYQNRKKLIKNNAVLLTGFFDNFKYAKLTKNGISFRSLVGFMA